MAGFSADIGTDAPVAPPAPNEFEKGLRSNTTALGGQLSALGARTAETAGYPDLARGLYSKSAALQQQSAAEKPRITDPSEINGPEDALDYGAGLMGGLIPGALPAVAAGLFAKTPVGKLVAGTLATAPSTIGGQVEAQQADPVQAAAPLDQRNLVAGGTGLAQAGLMSAVPAVAGAKVAGAFERTAAKGSGSIVGKNLAEAVGGNAAAGAASERVGQVAASELNPDRDTSQDAANVKSAAIGGGVGGLPFAAAGIAGDAFHGRGGSPRVAPGAEPGDAGTTGTPPAGAAPAPAKSTDVLQTVRDAIAGKGKPADDASQAATIAQGGDLVDDAKLASASPDAQPGIIKQASDATFAKVQQWAGQLADKADLTPDQRAQLDAATANLSDRGNQAIVAGLKVASDGVEKAKDIGARLSKAFGSDEPTAAQSTADAGPQRAIAQALIAATGDENAVHYAPGVAAAVDHAQVNGAFGGRDLKLLTDTLGDDARTALTAVHDAVGKTDPKSADKFYSAMQQLDEHVFKGVSLRDAVTSSLDPDVAEGMTPEHVQQLVDGIKGYVSDAGNSRLGAAEATLRRTDIRRELQKAFGDKTDDVIARFAEDQHSEGVATKADVADEHGQADELGPDAFENRYFGGGKNAKEPQFMERPDVHRAKFGNESQAERVLKAAQAANPDRAVDYISARDYAKANEVDDAKLAKATDGRPDDHVLVEARGMKQEGKLSKDDVDAVRLDTDKYPESKSRIDTGKQGETFDAVKLVEQMKKTLPYTTGDDSSGMARTKRAFQEGVAALSDHVGKNVKFDDATVVDRRGTTVGDLRKVTTDTASRGNSRERFEEMNDSELRRASNQLEVRLEKEAERRIAELKDSGARLSKADVGNVYADLKKTEVGKAHDAVSQEISKREADKQKEADNNVAGRTDADPAAEIHTAAASTTPEDLVRKENKPSNAGSVLKKDNTISKLGREQLSSKASELSAGRTAISRALGAKLRGLEGRLDDMTPTDQQRLLRVSTPGGDIVKAADTINELAKKYPAETTVKANPKTEAAKKKAFTDRVNAGDTKDILKRVAESQDEHGLRDAGQSLFDAAEHSEHAKEVLDAINKRLDDITYQNPDKQYSLQLMHASPHTFDKFDWASNLSRGEGAQAFGYGGYFASSKDVAAFYKEKFTPGAKNNALIHALRTSDNPLDVDLDKVKAPLYHVEAKLDPHEIMDYDKPLIEQRAILDKIYDDPNASKMYDIIRAEMDRQGVDPDSMTGANFYQSLADAQSPKYASTKLNSLGIKGHKYLDGFGRKAGDGDHNYVIYDAKHVDIKGVEYSKQGKFDPAIDLTPEQRTKVEDIIKTRLGDTVQTEFAKMLHGGEFEAADKKSMPSAKDIIRVSVHSLDPEGIAYHESMHAFMQALRASGDHNINRVLFTAADTHVVRAQLREMLKDSPEALKQIETSAEERAAYMYQLYEKGALKLGPKTEGVLGKIRDFLKQVLGIWSNDERALHIMKFFSEGEYAKNIGDRSALEAAFKVGTNKNVEAFKEFTKPLRSLASSVLSVGESRLRDTQVPALVKIADLVHTSVGREGAGGDTGYINAARETYTRNVNDLSKRLAPFNVDHLNDALESLQSGKAAASPEGTRAAAEIRKTLDASYEYMKQAGVKLGDLGYGKDYFPVVWGSSKITGNLDGFKAMLQKYKDAGAPIGDVNQVVAKLIGNGGSELGVERVMPGMQHTKTRVLDFIKPEDRAPFLNKNLYSTMNSYLQQASRRAEWARRFGDDNSVINKLVAQAEKDGATQDQIATAKKYLNGVNGTLGDDINPQFRRLFSSTLVYENVRLLSLGIFSSAPDAAGIFVRGGTVSDAFSTFKRGMVEIGRGFRDPENRKPDAAYQMAEDLGVIDSAMLQHVVGSVYSQDLTGLGKKINEGFFKYNLMDQYNRSMRVGATVAAGKFLARHGDGTESAHSTRWLAELGLKPGDVKMKDGDPLLTHAQFLDAGYSPAEAATRSTQMAAAVNKWVDGAILRPNAAQKPIYFNDPHFAFFSHLKQFVYSFQENILKRVVNEAKYGNYTPALGLASYIPIMIAADAAKGLIQGGGSQPNWKQGWDAGDYLWSGFQRAGLLGVGQFAADALEHKSGLLGVLGPTAEHFGEALSTVGGRERFGDFAIKSMPANALASPLLAHAGPDPSPNFAD